MDVLMTILMSLGIAFLGLLVIWLISLIIAFVVIALGAPDDKKFKDLNDIDFRN